jgi:hypothetical protein
MKCTVFLLVRPCKISYYHLFLLVSCLVYSSTLKMEATYSSETSGCLRTIRRYNPEDQTHQSHSRENIKSNFRINNCFRDQQKEKHSSALLSLVYKPLHVSLHPSYTLHSSFYFPFTPSATSKYYPLCFSGRTNSIIYLFFTVILNHISVHRQLGRPRSR